MPSGDRKLRQQFKVIQLEAYGKNKLKLEVSPTSLITGARNIRITEGNKFMKITLSQKQQRRLSKNLE